MWMCHRGSFSRVLKMLALKHAASTCYSDMAEDSSGCSLTNAFQTAGSLGQHFYRRLFAPTWITQGDKLADCGIIFSSGRSQFTLTSIQRISQAYERSCHRGRRFYRKARDGTTVARRPSLTSARAL